MNYKNIKLDKSMYKTDKGFAAQLEAADPSEQYKGTELEGLDAFERQLKRFDIKVSGSNSDKISKFFSVADSAALFPEYVSRAIASGADQRELLMGILATHSTINSLDYRSITTNLSSDVNPIVAEGALIPDVSISLSETLVSLKKRGKILSASYEAIRNQRADVLTVALAQIGSSLARTQLTDAIETLIYGNGSVPAAEVVSTPAASLSYDTLLELWGMFTDFDMNTLIVSSNTAKKILKFPEIRESSIGDEFLSRGTLITPFGAKLIKANAVGDDFIIGLDSRYALEMVTNGEIKVEYDKLIDTQLERAAVSVTYGFSKLFEDAVKVIELV